jgi:hypothetical protein
VHLDYSGAPRPGRPNSRVVSFRARVVPRCDRTFGFRKQSNERLVSNPAGRDRRKPGQEQPLDATPHFSQGGNIHRTLILRPEVFEDAPRRHAGREMYISLQVDSTVSGPVGPASQVRQ